MKYQQQFQKGERLALIGGSLLGVISAAIAVYVGDTRGEASGWAIALACALSGAILFGAVLFGLHPRSPFIRMGDWLAGSSTTTRLIMCIVIIFICSTWISDWVFFALFTMTFHRGGWIAPALLMVGPLAGAIIASNAMRKS